MPWLRRPRRGLGAAVWIAERLLETMEAEATEHAPDETGGMLVGYWSETGDAVITGTIGGGPGAVRQPSRFVADGAWQQKRLDQIYLGSGRVHTYLGEWHSHPTGGLRPSYRDRATARKIARTKEARAPKPLMLIAIGDHGVWQWGAFCYRGRRGFRRLTLIESSV